MCEVREGRSTTDFLPKIIFSKNTTCSIMELTRENLKFEISAPIRVPWVPEVYFSVASRSAGGRRRPKADHAPAIRDIWNRKPRKKSLWHPGYYSRIYGIDLHHKPTARSLLTLYWAYRVIPFNFYLGLSGNQFRTVTRPSASEIWKWIFIGWLIQYHSRSQILCFFWSRGWRTNEWLLIEAFPRTGYNISNARKLQSISSHFKLFIDNSSFQTGSI